MLLRSLLSVTRHHILGNRMLAYDGRKSAYAAGPLPFTSKDFVVKLDNEGSRRDREFKVSIRFASKADLHHLQQFLNGRQHDEPQETIHFLDVVLREMPSNIYKTVGRSFFSPMLGTQGELGNGSQFWKGFYQSLMPTGLSLNIDMPRRAFSETIHVPGGYIQKCPSKDVTRSLSDQDREKLELILRDLGLELNPSKINKELLLGADSQVNHPNGSKDYHYIKIDKVLSSGLYLGFTGNVDDHVSILRHFVEYNARGPYMAEPAAADLEDWYGYDFVLSMIESTFIEDGWSGGTVRLIAIRENAVMKMVRLWRVFKCFADIRSDLEF